MNDDEIRKQNRDDLLERMSESGNAHSSEYPYGLMMEAEEEIKRLRAECDEANKRIRQLLGDTEQLELTVARLTEDLRRMDAVITLVYVGIEKRKLREEGTS